MFRAAVVLALLGLVLGAEDDNDRIVGGRTALIKDCPWVVSLQINEVHKCGGVLLNQRIILTAAHCLAIMKKKPLNSLSVRAGSTIWSSGGQLAGIKQMLTHPKYNPETKQYDFGLIQLNKLFEFDITVKPATLPSKFPVDGENGLICGWGLKSEESNMVTTMLQSANVTIISRKKCMEDEKYNYKDKILDTMVCAQSPKIDACQGDSGGPLIIGNELSLITSFGSGCGRKEYPGVYATVLSVKNWVLKHMESF